MSTLIQRMQARYSNDHDFTAAYCREHICVLLDFCDRQQVMNAFWSRLYSCDLPRQVICGLNPDLSDEYLPGVPFSDFQRLARCMSEVERQDIEHSAPFFVKIIEAIGVESFFQRFYVTNVSAVGYFKEGRKLNYYDLPADALEFVERCFVEEMEIVRPQRVIALGREVEQTVMKLLPGIRLDYLPHPSWVMKQGGQEQQEWAEQYLSAMAVQ